jgi:hypothetical protein
MFILVLKKGSNFGAFIHSEIRFIRALLLVSYAKSRRNLNFFLGRGGQNNCIFYLYDFWIKRKSK